MEERIAVRCKSLEDVERVIKKHPCFDVPARDVWESYYKEDGAICITSTGQGWESETWYWREGYRIIEASEFLEGGKMEVTDEVDYKQVKFNGDVYANACNWCGKRYGRHSDYKCPKPEGGFYHEYENEPSTKHIKEEEEMTELISRVMKEDKHEDVLLVIKHKAKIIGNMEDTIYNERQLVTFGAGQLLKIAQDLEEAETEANKS